tara:strand:- start:4935 stop:5270 length:336 start_codon:yes stop_codon:yes gene_type:complete
MTHSWDDYYRHYEDWDDAHEFNVRVELDFEDKIKALGYIQYIKQDDFYLPENNFSNVKSPQSKTYIKNSRELILSFEVPYDWSIDTDWEDKALVLLGLREEWVIDSLVEDK